MDVAKYDVMLRVSKDYTLNSGDVLLAQPHKTFQVPKDQANSPSIQLGVKRGWLKPKVEQKPEPPKAKPVEEPQPEVVETTPETDTSKAEDDEESGASSRWKRKHKKKKA